MNKCVWNDLIVNKVLYICRGIVYGRGGGKVFWDYLLFFIFFFRVEEFFLVIFIIRKVFFFFILGGFVFACFWVGTEKL